jgi:co-chaperonin GroES (HSP10)
MLEALGSKLIVRRVEQEQTSALGIIISNSQDPNPRAEVVSIGPKLAELHPALEVGDHLAIEWTQTATIRDQGKTYYILDASSVYAKERV